MNRYYVSNESTADQLKYVVKDVETREVVCECERLKNADAIAEALNLGLVEVDFKHVSIATMENKKRIIGVKGFMDCVIRVDNGSAFVMAPI